MLAVQILAAVIPAAILLVQVYLADRLEKEPIKLLVTLVICGIAATELAYFAERGAILLLDRYVPADSLLYDVLLFFVVVAVSEEGFKYLLLRLQTWRSPDFNCSFDGVVYAVFVSLGFALWENIQYVLEYGLTVALARAVTAIPGHACFGVFMGTWYGIAKRWQQAGHKKRRRLARFLSCFLPMLVHGGYDSIAVFQDEGLTLAFVIFVTVLFVVSLGLVRHLSVNDKYIKLRTKHAEENVKT